MFNTLVISTAIVMFGLLSSSLVPFAEAADSNVVVIDNFNKGLNAGWNKVKAVMMEGTLSPKVKQTIAVLVSRDNSCAYCVAAHTGALRAMGVTDEELAAIEEDLDKAEFSIKEKALINFARQANINPGKIPDADFMALRDTGATDSEIVEALGVMELFTAFNKFLDSMEVPVGS